MHPIERLRHVTRVARASGVEHGVLVQEAAVALAGMGADVPGMVLSCKRLVDRHSTAGPLWWLCARLLTADDLAEEAWECLRAIDDDTTPRSVVRHLPDDATVTVLGWPELLAQSLHRRGDLQVLVVDVGGDGYGFARQLQAAELDAVEVPDTGLAGAVLASDVVLLEAAAAGGGAVVATAGSRAAAAVAQHAGIPVWAVVGVGRALPVPMFDVLAARLAGDEPWEADVELVPADLIDGVLGPDGFAAQAEASTRADCPVAAELL